ncbi:MAG: pectin acetylesterase-family hydrolase [Hyphomonadaceae bacterium]
MKARLILTVLAFAFCAGARQAPVAVLTPRQGSWEEFTPQATRVDGRWIDPTCSDAPGVIGLSLLGAPRWPDRLVIFFAGGGAAWNDITCSVPRLANGRPETASTPPSCTQTTIQRFSGMFDLSNPNNPVRDWSFIYVPYCTGDVHSGSNTATYTDPDTGEPFTIQHRGADNFRIILRWAEENFRRPARILVAGSSAGAYGAATHYARIRSTFPRGQAAFIGDAGQGVMTGNCSPCAWHYDVPRSLFDRSPPTINDDLVARLAERYPNDRFAQFTTAHDYTQTAFYALMGGENACRTWTEKMTHDLSAREEASNFRAYVAAGQMHTILRSPAFYSETSGGEPFAVWFHALVERGAQGWETQVTQDSAAPARTCPF